ncbi:MAG: hypothetical protein ABI689_17300, partial [Thermoanaerobaculia bacterium]
STTGAQPQPESRIARAACAAVAYGVQHEDTSTGFMTSLQQLMFRLLFWFQKFGFNGRLLDPLGPRLTLSGCRICAIRAKVRHLA